MLELIGLGIAGAVGMYGHMKSRSFVRRRLRYTSWVEKRGIGIMTGAATMIVVAALPVVTLAPALLVGAGIGTGVGMGARDARSRKMIED